MRGDQDPRPDPAHSDGEPHVEAAPDEAVGDFGDEDQADAGGDSDTG